MVLTPVDFLLLGVSLAAPLALFLLTIRPYLRYLVRRGLVQDDLHKRPPTKVPSPAGPLIFLCAVAGEVVVYLVFGTLIPIALIGCATVSFAVGMVDDFRVLGAKTKPLLLLLSGVPFVACVVLDPNLYNASIAFPFFGSTSHHFLTYTVLIFAAFPIVANAFNMVDGFNGEVSGFSVLTSLALVFAIALRLAATPGYPIARLASALPLVAVSVGFFLYNRYPSRAFDGDSGSLMLGTLYAGLAITGGVDVAAIVAIMPAVLNSFYVLSSVRGLVERRRMGGRPTYIGDDGKLYASKEPGAPATLARMILLDGPLSEQELVGAVLKLTIVSCLLSALTSILTWVV